MIAERVLCGALLFVNGMGALGLANVRPLDWSLDARVRLGLLIFGTVMAVAGLLVCVVAVNDAIPRP